MALLNGLYIRLDLRNGPWWFILVEIPVEVDLVADDSDLAVLVVAFRRVDPGVRARWGFTSRSKKARTLARHFIRVGGVLSIR